MDPVTVLVVDDLEDFRDLLKIAARSDGRCAVVAEAGEGVEGIRLAGAMQPDVVILDLHMPLMDGLEAIEGIRSLAPQTRIVAWSSFDVDFGEDAVVLGADSHVSKAAGVHELIETVVAIAQAPVTKEAGSLLGDAWVAPYLTHSVSRTQTSEFSA